MWRGYHRALAAYGQAVCDAWSTRGYVDTCRDKISALVNLNDPVELPPWFGDLEFHRAHQSNLVRKLPDYYGPLFPEVPSTLPYVWPVVGV